MVRTVPLGEFQMLNHTYLFTVGGVSFYEHEEFGDEFNLIAKIDGKWIDTYYMDKPSIEEVKELVADVMDGHEETYEVME
jgi:hypothetical protein